MEPRERVHSKTQRLLLYKRVFSLLRNSSDRLGNKCFEKFPLYSYKPVHTFGNSDDDSIDIDNVNKLYQNLFDCQELLFTCNQ